VTKRLRPDFARLPSGSLGDCNQPLAEFDHHCAVASRRREQLPTGNPKLPDVRSQDLLS
jgi:hypothetical protein